MKNLLLYVVISSILLVSFPAFADPLLTRNSRIKQNGSKIYAVVPFYQWYLDKYNLTKDDFKDLEYPFNSKYGVVKPFMKAQWGLSKRDARVKLSINYTKVPKYDVLIIKGKKIIIKYVSNDEFINSAKK